MKDSIKWRKAPLCEVLTGESVRTSKGEGRLSWRETYVRSDELGPVIIGFVLWKPDSPEIRETLPAFATVEVADREVW